MAKRREPQSSALSFMDCICCGFGAVLLLFILTAKRQVLVNTEAQSQTREATVLLQTAIAEAMTQNQALDAQLASLAPVELASTVTLKELTTERDHLAQTIASEQQALKASLTEADATRPAALDRPSADRKYLNGLELRGPRAVIVLENSGSMLAETANEAVDFMRNANSQKSQKWQRAKAAVRAVLAAIPKGTQVALFQMNESTSALSGSNENPFIDPYDNTQLLSALNRLDQLSASGGADLNKGLRTISAISQRPSSMLLITDGLPTAPANGGTLSEVDRVRLFKNALTAKVRFPINTLLFPFEGDPAAAGLYWKLSTRTGGITLVPNPDWPAL